MVIELPTSPVSPELAAARHRCGILTEVFGMLTQATIRAAQGKRAGEILDYMNNEVLAAESEVEALTPKEPADVVASNIAEAAMKGANEAIQAGH